MAGAPHYGGLPDPDWYVDNVLAFAEPGIGGRVDAGPAARWQQWWHARELADELAPFRQTGFVATTAQLAGLGYTRKAVRVRVARGDWVVAARGVVGLVPAAELDDGRPWQRRRRRHALACAAATVLNSGHRVRGLSAAVLFGLPTLREPDRVRLGVVRLHGAHRPGTSRSSFAPSTDLSSWFGCPVFSIARTVVDLARSGRQDGLIAADAALFERLVDRSELEQTLALAAHRPGVVQAREIVAFADPGGESPLESLTRLAIHDSGLPAPELQARIAVAGGRRYRVDMLWRARRLIVELDGRDKYRDDAALWQEKLREDRLREQGYRFLRLTWDDVLARWPATEARLRAALGRPPR